MEPLEIIYKRQSVRKYSDKDVSEEEIKQILQAGFSGPTCAGTKPFQYIVVTDKEILKQMRQVNGRYAGPIEESNFAIIACVDNDYAYPKHKEYGIVDVSIATQNMILAAYTLGIGACWIGTWPEMERVQGEQELFNLPSNIMPLAVVAFGYPEEPLYKEENNPYMEERVHFNKW